MNSCQINLNIFRKKCVTIAITRPIHKDKIISVSLPWNKKHGNYIIFWENYIINVDSYV